MKTIEEVAQAIIDGYAIDAETALELMQKTDAGRLYAAANRIRRHFCGDRMDLCSIINARSGRCSEDCKWCSQSHAHHTGIKEYPLVDAAEAVAMARRNWQKGVHRFSLVTSGRTVTDRQLDELIAIYNDIKKVTDIQLCASMGLLNKQQLQRLHDTGLTHYHCNIETAPSFFPHVCTTHTIADKVQTIRWAHEVGMSVCSGGIIGMGETPEQRVEMAVFLRSLDVQSIPVNTLMPIAGTRLEGRPTLPPEEVFRTMAMFRLVNPRAFIRMAGGRAQYYAEQQTALRAGVNASIVGDMLTTIGARTIDDDLRDLKLDVE